MGLTVVADYGPAGGVRIPLAVGHPHLNEALGVAILSDTDAYVATPSLRVRDRHWVERLERRGWDVVVLASLDVFLDFENTTGADVSVVVTATYAPGTVDHDSTTRWSCSAGSARRPCAPCCRRWAAA